MAGLSVSLFLIKGFFDFTGLNDAAYLQYFGDEVMTMIRRDREAVYINDTIRSLIYVILAAIALWLFLKGRMGRNLFAITLTTLIVTDLVGVDRRYVNEEDFVRKREMTAPFRETAVDRQIQEDPGIFRVYDPAEGLNGARTSFFHQSIGGYHAAKPARIQDLFDFHIYKNNLEVLNMLNVKYVAQQDEEGNPTASMNPGANGNAWFAEAMIPVADADEEITALDSLNTRRQAVVNRTEFPGKISKSYRVDSTAAITLGSYEPNHLTYESTNSRDGLAVFSEMYYPHGWQAYLDGTPVPHFRVNYVLRAMEIPAGRHSIEFKFEPEVVERGSHISLAANILLCLLLLGGILYKVRPPKAKQEDDE
jgi:hypothetical protein